MAIVDFKTNKPLTAREIKRRVMAATGWTSEQYQKQYDILRNKTRNYETATGGKTKIKVNELLYQQTAAQKRYGASYKPSRLTRAIMATPSASTGTVQRKGVSRATEQRIEREILGEFGQFTRKSAEGRKIAELYQKAKSGRLPAEIERLENEYIDALESGEIDLAEQLRAEIKELRDAPRNIAQLKEQLTSAAKSLREYQKNKRGEWRRKNPDAPADYTVGTP